ncbi:MAG: hypothetical protein ACOZB3_09435 [Calditrichota bacterium]
MDRAFGTELIIFGVVITVLWTITVFLATAWARNVMRQLESINDQLRDTLQRLVRAETRIESQQARLTQFDRDVDDVNRRLDRVGSKP